MEGAAALVVAYLGLVAVYPNAFGKPTVLAYQAIVVSAKFPFNEPIMFNGTWVGQPVPLSYLPTWFAAQLPLLVTIGAVGFAVLWTVQVVRRLVGRETSMSREVLVMVTVVVVQAVAVPAVAIAGRATMYNAVRQYLFVVPAASILAALGVWALAGWMARKDLRRPLVVAVWVLVCIGVIAPTIAQLRLFPYNYTYYNAIAAARGIDGVWPTDYWRASSQEIMSRLPAQGPESCAYEQTRAGELSPCSDQPMFEPYLENRGVDSKAGTLAPGEYWLVQENQGRTDVPEGCRLHDEITRPLFGRTITIAQIMACPMSAGPAQLPDVSR